MPSRTMEELERRRIMLSAMRRGNRVTPSIVNSHRDRTRRARPRNDDQIKADNYVSDINGIRVSLKEILRKYGTASEGSKEARLEDFRDKAKNWPRYDKEGNRVVAIDNLFENPYPSDKVIKEIKASDRADIVKTALLIARETNPRNYMETELTAFKAKFSNEIFKESISKSLENILPEYAEEHEELPPPEYNPISLGLPGYSPPRRSILSRFTRRRGGSYKKKRRVRKKTRRLKRRN
jgi:hypothetical protein